MTETQSELADAEAKSREARARLTATLVDIQSRINPRALARDAIDEIREAGTQAIRAGLSAAKRNPGSMMAIGATLIALFARGWIAEAIALKPNATVKTDPRLTDNRPAPDEGTNND